MRAASFLLIRMRPRAKSVGGTPGLPHRMPCPGLLAFPEPTEKCGEHRDGNAQPYEGSPAAVEIEPQVHAVGACLPIKTAVSAEITGDRGPEIVRTVRLDRLVALLPSIADACEIAVQEAGDKFIDRKSVV